MQTLTVEQKDGMYYVEKHYFRRSAAISLPEKLKRPTIKPDLFFYRKIEFRHRRKR